MNNTIEIVLELLSLLFVVIGGGFALYQWKKSVIYKRTEIVRDLIAEIRGNETISSIMDIIDWNEAFAYNGSFTIVDAGARKHFSEVTNDRLMQMMDYTLSHFSYICYLKEVHTLERKDMYFFEYELRRLMDNPHICNYLFSLYHWSTALNVHMSFAHLITYGIKHGYLKKTFYTYHANHPHYECCLQLPSSYIASNTAHPL